MQILSVFNFLLANTEPDPGWFQQWGMFVILGLLVVSIIALPMLSRRKRGKQVNDLRTTLRLGDEVMTAGGIVGTIIQIIEHSPTDKDFIIETGQESNKSVLRFDLRALYENRTRIKELREEAAKQAELVRIAKEEKKSGKGS